MPSCHALEAFADSTVVQLVDSLPHPLAVVLLTHPAVDGCAAIEIAIRLCCDVDESERQRLKDSFTNGDEAGDGCSSSELALTH